MIYHQSFFFLELTLAPSCTRFVLVLLVVRVWYPPWCLFFSLAPRVLAMRPGLLSRHRHGGQGSLLSRSRWIALACVVFKVSIFFWNSQLSDPIEMAPFVLHILGYQIFCGPIVNKATQERDLFSGLLHINHLILVYITTELTTSNKLALSRRGISAHVFSQSIRDASVKSRMTRCELLGK